MLFRSPRTPIEESLRALDDLVKAGKIRYFGASHFAPWQHVEAHYVARMNGLSRMICCEDEYSVLVRKAEKELLPAARACQMGILPYYPLASGMLTGKYAKDAEMPKGSRMQRAERNYADVFFTEANWNRLRKLTDFAEQRGHTILELAVSWLLAQPIVGSVIAGATKPEQVEANVKAANWALTAQELKEVDEIEKARKSFGAHFA